MTDSTLPPSLPRIPAGKLFGIAGEFATPEALLSAAHHIRSQGFTNVEAYTPLPVEGLAEALDQKDHPVALLTLLAGMIGGLTGFGMCWYANVINFQLNIGGRPHNSWPAWIPITFELTVLFAALTAAIGMLALSGLPRLNHPMFDAPGFERASRDRFFLCIEATDANFSIANATSALASTGAISVSEVRA